jgi:PIN domain nuclease of toxin-antitoxin system
MGKNNLLDTHTLIWFINGDEHISADIQFEPYGVHRIW